MMRRLLVLLFIALSVATFSGQYGGGMGSRWGGSGGFQQGTVRWRGWAGVETWAIRYAGGIQPWTPDSTAAAASYDGLILGRDVMWDDIPLDDIYDANPALKVAGYIMPGVTWRRTWGAAPDHFYSQDQDALFPYMVGTTRNTDDTADCSGGIAAGCDTAQYNGLTYVVDLNDPAARAATIGLAEVVRDTMLARNPGIPSEMIGVFLDIPDPMLTAPAGDPGIDQMYGEVDLDGDGIGYSADLDYNGEGLSEPAAYNRGLRLLMADLEAAFPKEPIIINGLQAVLDSTFVQYSTHFCTEHTPQGPPFYWNYFADFIAGGKMEGEYPADDPVDTEIFYGIDSYARWSEDYDSKLLMISCKEGDDSGYNVDPLAALAMMYGFAYSPVQDEGASSHRVLAETDKSFYTASRELGRRKSVVRQGEGIKATFSNGEMHMRVSLGKDDPDDPVDYWAVNSAGDTLITHWHGETTYTYKFGDQNNLAGSTFDRHFGPDAAAGKTRLCQLDASSPNTAESNSYCTIAGNEDWGLLSFSGSYGKSETSMRRVLIGENIAEATLRVYGSFDDRTLSATDTLYVIAGDDTSLVGWDLPLHDVGGHMRPQPTFNEKRSGEAWDLAGRDHDDVGTVWATVTDTVIAANAWFDIDVTDLIRECADPEVAWAGIWLRYARHGGGSSSLNFENFRTMLDVKVYAPWVNGEEGKDIVDGAGFVSASLDSIGWSDGPSAPADSGFVGTRLSSIENQWNGSARQFGSVYECEDAGAVEYAYLRHGSLNQDMSVNNVAVWDEAGNVLAYSVSCDHVDVTSTLARYTLNTRLDLELGTNYRLGIINTDTDANVYYSQTTAFIGVAVEYQEVTESGTCDTPIAFSEDGQRHHSKGIAMWLSMDENEDGTE